MSEEQASRSPRQRQAPPGYFSHMRPELLERIPTDARTILELGCGAGVLGQAVKQRQQARVVGIEGNLDAATAASNVIDEVHCANLDNFDFPWPEQEFDCVVAGDVLEHLVDPWSMLDKIKAALCRNGTLLVSIPNASFPQVIEQLANGRFDYEDQGILDRTHLRFFTRQTFSEALEQAGFSIVRVEPLLNQLYYQIPESVRDTGGSISFGTVSVQMRDSSHILDIMTYQWLFLATA